MLRICFRFVTKASEDALKLWKGSRTTPKEVNNKAPEEADRETTPKGSPASGSTIVLFLFYSVSVVRRSATCLAGYARIQCLGRARKTFTIDFTAINLANMFLWHYFKSIKEEE